MSLLPTAGARVAGELAKPRLRGVLHQWAFVTAVVAGAVLVGLAPGGRATWAAAVYGLCLAALFGTSALYHRVGWRARGRAVMRRLDHSMIFVFIAGSYTPFALLVLRGGTATAVLAGVWIGAVVGVASRVAFTSAPRLTTVPLYVALGWVAAFTVPQLIRHGGIAPFVLLCVGGAAYTVGGLVYATRRPDPAPAVFGYHELFHLMTLVAAVCHYIAVSFAVYRFG